eukprot:SAG11_NODE_19860_length_457_cov_1.164804_1_plen_36_part_01
MSAPSNHVEPFQTEFMGLLEWVTHKFPLLGFEHRGR